MNLNAWSADRKREIFDRLESGQPPGAGSFDEALWKEANEKGSPQIGATNYKPDKATFEFIYHMDEGPPMVLTVAVEPPERIVFLPVPEWVVLSIWHGEALGSFQFESEAQAMLDRFALLLQQEPNAEIFGEQPAAIGRA